MLLSEADHTTLDENERCFKPIHVYDVATGRPVMVLLRPGKTPSGKEVRGHLRRLVRRLHWPNRRLTIRGDSHYGRPEVILWCENNSVDYMFGLAGSDPLAVNVEAEADAIRVERAEKNADAVGGFAETTHAAKCWKIERRVAARIEATPLIIRHSEYATALQVKHFLPKVKLKRRKLAALFPGPIIRAAQVHV
jgi:hypothetical protein